MPLSQSTVSMSNAPSIATGACPGTHQRAVNVAHGKRCSTRAEPIKPVSSSHSSPTRRGTIWSAGATTSAWKSNVSGSSCSESRSAGRAARSSVSAPNRLRAAGPTGSTGPRSGGPAAGRSARLSSTGTSRTRVARTRGPTGEEQLSVSDAAGRYGAQAPNSPRSTSNPLEGTSLAWSPGASRAESLMTVVILRAPRCDQVKVVPVAPSGSVRDICGVIPSRRAAPPRRAPPRRQCFTPSRDAEGPCRRWQPSALVMAWVL